MKCAWISLAALSLVMGCKTSRAFGAGESSGGNGGDTATGDGDAGGETGDGDGDEQPEPECVRASDCPPADGCNEAATCQKGECVAGASECGAFDSDNCACVDIDSACTVQGADADEDGAKSALCEADPGDDCDDAQPTVYPGAEEACDGLDNDCDRLIDLDDGLEPFVRRVYLPDAGETNYSDTALAWSDSANAYGAAWTTLSVMPGGLESHHVNWGWIELDGTFKETLSTIIYSGVDTAIEQIAVANGEKEIAVAAVEDSFETDAIVHVRRIARTGTSTIGQVTSFPTSFESVEDLHVVSRGPDDFLVIYAAFAEDVRTTYVTRIHNGTVVAESAETPLTDSPEEFAESGAVLLPWYSTTGSGTEQKWSVFSHDSPEPVAGGIIPKTEGFISVPGALGPRLGFVSQDWSTEKAEFFSLNAKAWECKGVTIPYVLASSPIAPLSLSDGGWVLASFMEGTYGSPKLYFSRVYADCSASVGLAEQQFGEGLGGGTEAYNGMIAAGNGKGIAVVWREVGERTPRRVGLFGPNICDDPDQ